MKKNKLDAEISFDFDLIGIITPEKEYKIAWSFNSAFDIRLMKEKDIELEFLNSQNLLISNYLYETEHSFLRILKNKSINEFSEKPGFLLPELEKFDYLVLVNGFGDTYPLVEIKNKIASIPKVQYVQTFTVENFKSKENLIF